MKRTIQISSPICKKLMDTYHVSRQTVWRAMSYQRNNLLSRKLRCMALTLGGHAVVTAPEIETLWDHKGTMTQFFPNGVKMLLIKDSNSAELYHNDKLVATYEQVKIGQVTLIQAEALIAHNPTFQPMPLED